MPKMTFDVQKFVAGLHDYIRQALSPLASRLKTLEERPPPKDGVDGTSVTLEEVRPLVQELVDGIPKPQDGKSVTLEDVRPLLEELVAAIPKPQDGKSVTLEDVQSLLQELVDQIEKPKDGASVTLEDVRPMVRDMLAEWPKPKDGERGEKGEKGEAGVSVSPDDVMPAIEEKISQGLIELRDLVENFLRTATPKDGKDGENGKDGTSVTIEQVLNAITPDVRAWLEVNGRGEKGDKGDRGETGADGKDGRDGVYGKDGKDGADGKPGEKGEKGERGEAGQSFTQEDAQALIESVLDKHVGKWALDFERRAHDLLQRVADKIPLPKDGKDAFQLDDYEEEYDGERTLTRRYRVGDNVKEFKHRLNMLLERGVYVRGKDYERGDCVTWGGNYWAALVDTSKQPGDGNEDWRLIVRKGRDGRDLRTEKDKPAGAPVVNLNGGTK